MKVGIVRILDSLDCSIKAARCGVCARVKVCIMHSNICVECESKQNQKKVSRQKKYGKVGSELTGNRHRCD